MQCPKVNSGFLVLCFLAAAGPLSDAQAGQEISSSAIKAVPVREVLPPMPFLAEGATPGRLYSIDFRSSGEMAQEDRDLEAGAEPAIGERARLLGLEFVPGQWSYRQVECTALPGHLLLQFTRNQGAGDVSVFTASIPRSGGGRVRVVPVERRGYSLFSPAPVNALTIAAFNRIRAEEQPGRAPDWVATGLCYAALAGAQAHAAMPEERSEDKKFLVGAGAVLEIPGQGGAEVRFMELAETPRPMDWSMSFDGKGRLLKAEHTPAPRTAPKTIAANKDDGSGSVVPRNSPASEGKPIPQGNVDLSGKPIPASVVVERPIPRS
jgi:hypothetical protein